MKWASDAIICSARVGRGTLKDNFRFNYHCIHPQMKRDVYLLHLFPLSALQLIAAIEELKHNAMERVTDLVRNLFNYRWYSGT